MIVVIFCTRSIHDVLPIHRINLRWARTNSRSLRLTYTPIPTPLDRGQSLNMFKDRPRPSRPCRSFPLRLRSLPFSSRLFPIGPDFQIGFNREWIVAQWNGGINLSELYNCLCATVQNECCLLMTPTCFQVVLVSLVSRMGSTMIWLSLLNGSKLINSHWI